MDIGPSTNRLVNQSRTFLESRALCQKQGADLVSIEDELASAFVFRLATRTTDAVWLGLTYVSWNIFIFLDDKRHDKINNDFKYP